MNTFSRLLTEALDARKAEGALRTLKTVPTLSIDFSSNDYLGLARSVELRKLIDDRIHSIPEMLNGSTGSRLLSGNNQLIEEAEEELAQLFNAEACLIFNSGYAANLAVLSAIPKRGDTILYDELAHASLKDGARLSLATRLPFKHNDLNQLERKLEKTKGNVFVVVESIYSMDGDSCPLVELVKLCNQFGAHLILDEAHSTGIYGEVGNGIACELNIHNDIPIRIYTFGKAMGVHGACVVGNHALKQYLINFARPFIYTTAPDYTSIISATSAFRFLRDTLTLQNDLQHKIKVFKTQMHQHPQLLPSASAIQSFIIPGNDQVRQAAQTLQQANLDVRPILSPTVTKDTERLRIILHTFNKDSEIKELAEKLHALSSHT